MWGNTGKLINLNLTDGSLTVGSLPEEYYRTYIGGSGLAAKIFWERGDFSADPLAPEAMLIFMSGPFAGLKLSGASRSSVAGRSPLTGHWGDSSCGGHFAPELRYCGFDGIVITGKAPRPSMLVIEGENTFLEDATEFWGKGIEAVHRSIKERYGKGYRSLIIGPAGESLVKFANILNERHHAFGRAGFGAVMGSKNLKAIVVRAKTRDMRIAHPERYNALRKELNTKIREALASQVIHENGTAANLEGGVYSGDVPIKNFTSNFWEEMAEALTGSTLTERYLTNRGACAYCEIACKRVVEVKEGPFAVPKGPGPEYETIVAFGSLLGSMNLAAACKAGRICNDLGMDTISCGATIAWAMEAVEKGDISREDTEGLDLVWGDMETVVNFVLPKIAARDGKLGRLLADGSVSSAKIVGRGSAHYTVHSKGLEAPMHDPRGGGHGMALTYAMSPRGACHVADPMLFFEMGACYYPEIGFEFELEPKSDENKPESAVASIALGSIENSACYCVFADREISIPEWVELFNTVAGFDWNVQDMMKAGRRIFYLKRLINYRYGLTAADDSLTPRMLERARDGEPEGIEINFDEMNSRFYELMGIDPNKGIPLRETLEEHDMADEAHTIW